MKHYQFEPTHATCPICSNSQAQILWSVSSEQATRHYVVEAADPQRFSKLVAQIERLWQQDTCEVVRCESCGFCYSHPYVAGDDLFYTLAYERSHYPTWKWEHQLSYQTLKAQRNFTLLEIGAGDGAFVKRIAPALTPKENILCAEFSSYGREQISQYGITCLSEDVRSLKVEEIQTLFDVICLFQVIEHLDRLDHLFQQLNRLTQEGASLFISVPNPALIEFAELHDGLLDMPPNHIGRWNRACFDEIGRRWGWIIQDYAVEQNSWIDKVQLFCKYRFWKSAQQPGSFASLINASQINSLPIKKLMQLISVGVCGLTALPVLPKLQSQELGFSQWVHLKKLGQ